MLGDTRNSPTWANNAITRGFFDAVWPDLLPSDGGSDSIVRLGDILNYGKAYMAGQVGVTQTAGSISSSQSDGNIVMWHVFGDPTLELWTGKPLRILPEIFTILLREANRWRIEYEVEGAIITILQGGVPVGRAPVINGVADIPLIRDLELQVPVGGLQISASMPGEVSAGLGAPSVSADLAVTKTAAPSSIVVGEHITYAIAVTNQGPDQATGVFVEDFLPQGVTFVSVSSSQGDCFQQTAGIACELGDLPPGTTATVELVGKATQAGTVNNSATATGDEDDPDTANNSGQVSVTIGTG